MLPIDLLQARQRSLQEQYKLLAEKLMQLRKNSAITADINIQFQLKNQIQQVEAELVETSHCLDEINQASEDGNLYQVLLKLGYRKQVQIFRKFVRNHPIAAFLICGRLDYGQRWLLNRLVVQHTRDSIVGKVVKINLSRVARRVDVAALWRELSGRTGLGRHGTITEITNRVYQWWQTQHVLLVFHEVDFLSETLLNELLQNFWVPLAMQASKKSRAEIPYKLLMFLVDYDGRVGDWNVLFAEDLDSRWQPGIPVKLPLINEFTESELVNWLEFSADDLPIDWIDKIDETAQNILDNSDNGIPEPAFGEICRWAGSDWYENEEKWMKL